METAAPSSGGTGRRLLVEWANDQAYSAQVCPVVTVGQAARDLTQLRAVLGLALPTGRTGPSHTAGGLP